jgi:hypothetical protein
MIIRPCLGRDLDPALRPLARVRPGGPALLLQAGNPEAGQAALAVTGCGEPGACPAGTPGTSEPATDPGLLYAACQRVLRPDGVLAVIATSTPCRGRLRDHPGEAITRARAAGLVYAQHIVAAHAAIRDSQIAPGEDAARPGPAHVRIHSDFLVFTKPGTPASSAGLKGFSRNPRVRCADCRRHPWVPGLDDGWISRGRARRLAGIFSRAATAW